MSRAELIRLTSEIPIGGSEDDTKNAVKKLFEKNNNKFSQLSNEDIKELDRLYDLEEAQLMF